ncbi:MAG: cell division FtsA domain-containing protein [Chloroflexota bacterium]
MATSLDVGTEYVKALVFRIEEGEGTVVGAGRHRQGLGQMQAATVTDIGGVVNNCRAALREAESSAGIHPTQVIIGIAGELVKGFTTSHSQERKRADTPITSAELDRLIEGVQREALLEAERSITWETGLPSVDVRLVHAAVVGAAIDGYPVNNPVGFKGRHVRIGVFNAFAPLVHLGALQTVARRLDRQLLAIVAEPYAVARCIRVEDLGSAGALFVDIGGGTTDVALVRQGGVEGTRMFALGGRAFTKSLSDRLEVSFEDAERIKIAYASGQDVDHPEQVASIIAEDVAVWAAGMELVLEEFGRHGQLPARIELCGGGSHLPQLSAALRDPQFAANLPFVRPPTVGVIAPDQVRNLVDRTGKLTDQQDVTPMALAVQAVELTGPGQPLDAALKRVLRSMRV